MLPLSITNPPEFPPGLSINNASTSQPDAPTTPALLAHCLGPPNDYSWMTEPSPSVFLRRLPSGIVSPTLCLIIHNNVFSSPVFSTCLHLGFLPVTCLPNDIVSPYHNIALQHLNLPLSSPTSRKTIQNNINQFSACFLFSLFITLCDFITFLFFISSFVSYTGMAALSSDCLTVLSMNTNRFRDALKLNTFAGLIVSVKPHIFIVNKTKSSQPITHHAHIPDYTFYENPGVPIGRGKGKWGVLVGVHQDVQVFRCITTLPILQGRMVALDIIIPSQHGETNTV